MYQILYHAVKILHAFGTFNFARKEQVSVDNRHNAGTATRQILHRRTLVILVHRVQPRRVDQPHAVPTERRRESEDDMVDLSGTRICLFRKGGNVVGQIPDRDALLLCTAEYQTGRLLRAVPNDNVKGSASAQAG